MCQRLIRRTIDGMECIFYKQNLLNDYAVLMKCGSEQVTTGQMKKQIDTVIDIISNIVEAGAVFDEHLKKIFNSFKRFQRTESGF